MTERVTITLVEPGEDIELKAMSYMLSVLENLSAEQRSRVLTWLFERCKSLRGGE